MTHAEFLAWLDGYLTGRDTADAALIRQKLGEVKAPVGPVFPFGLPVVAPIFHDKRGTSANPIPVHPYTTCDAGGIPAVAGALSDGMKPLGADFQRAIFSDTEALYEN